MAGVANGWQWSNGQPDRDYGNCSVQFSPLFLFYYYCKTFLFVQNKLSHKPWSWCRDVWVLIPPTPTEILQVIQVQRHMKCVDAEQLCCKDPNGKPCQTSRECEGQNGFLCPSPSPPSHSYHLHPLSLSSDRPLELPKCHRVCRNKINFQRYGTVWAGVYENVPKTGCSLHFSILHIPKDNM